MVFGQDVASFPGPHTSLGMRLGRMRYCSKVGTGSRVGTASKDAV